MPTTEHDGRPGLADNLMAFVLEADEFPSSERADEILKEDNLDLSRLNSWAQQKLSGLRARQKLQEAKEARETCLEILAKCSRPASEELSSLRESILAKLKVISSSDPDAALIYCRRFRDAPDDDLPGLEADLNLLDSLEDETGESD